MTKACEIIHQRIFELPRNNWNTPVFDSPSNGIYVVFEKGERAHNGDRIVRVGTHTGDGNLAKRLKEHAFPPYRSIMRRHIGRCILAKEGSSLLADWSLPITKAADRKRNLLRRQHPRLVALDEEITKYINKKMSFSVFQVKNASRTKIESRILSTIAQCEECAPTANWLGRNFPNLRYKNFPVRGLWNVTGMRDLPMTPTEARRLPMGGRSFQTT